MKQEIHDWEPTITIDIYGKPTRCRVLRAHSAHTMDVERLEDGKCFRASGLQLAHHASWRASVTKPV